MSAFKTLFPDASPNGAIGWLSMMTTTARLQLVIQPGLAAVRALWLPFALIQLTGLAVVLAYFYWPTFARLCDEAGHFKARVGVLFAAFAMPIAGGLVPELFKIIAGVDRSFSRQRLAITLHNMILFAAAGVCVDSFYTLVNALFAGTPPVVSVPSKVLIDQLVYTPLIGVPIISLSYTLRQSGYRPCLTLRQITPAWYGREVLPVLVTCWAYWFPMTSLMYTLPSSLTFIYGMLANAASATLLTAVAGRHEARRSAEAAPLLAA